MKYDVQYIMLLSGTPAPNTPGEIVPLINLLCTKKQDQWPKPKWNKMTTTVNDKQSFFIIKVFMYNTGPKYNYMRRRETTFESKNSFPGYKVSTRK